jgi:autotransporter-associated beta strand protein
MKRARIIEFAALGVSLGLIPTSAFAQSVDIPLNYALNTGYNFGAAPTSSNPVLILTINVGVNGSAAQAYAFDTGSAEFLAPNGTFGNAALQSNLSDVETYTGNTFGGNVYQIPASSLKFYATAGATAGGISLGPSGNYNVASYTSLNNNNTVPAQPFGSTVVGAFGAEPQAFDVSGTSPTVAMGSIFGQTILPNTTAGWVVSANGQSLAALNSQLGTSIPGGPAGSGQQSIQTVPQSVTNCNPCVTVGLTPALLAQFLPLNTAISSATGVPFPNSNVQGYDKFVPLDFTLSSPTTTLHAQNVSLDSGFTDFHLDLPPNYATSFPNPVLTVSANSGGTQETFDAINPNFTSATAGSPSPYSLRNTSDPTTNFLGIGFFLENSVLYNLAGQVEAYSPNFVTDANIATTGGSPLAIGSSSVPLGLAGVISGAGGVSITSGGSATLSGTNTYTGPTSVSGGFLALVGPGSIATSSGVAVSAGGTFDISGVTNGASIVSLSGNGNVALGGNALTLSNAAGTFSGVIADGGQSGGSGGVLALSGGTETLTGANTYTGGTQLNAGMLVVGNNNALGPGVLSMAAGTTLSFLDTGNFTLANNITVSGDPAFAPPANTTQTISGVIFDGASAGSVSMQGPGTLVLSGANTYTGGTSINGGTLALSGSGSIAQSSFVLLATGATLDISGLTNGGTSIVTLGNTAATGQTGSVVLGANTLTLSDPSTAFAGVIGGTGALAQSAGIEELTGANTYSGGTFLNGGTLVVGNNSALGTGALSMAPGTTLEFLNTGNFTIANPIKISGDPTFAPPSGTTQTLSGVISNGAAPGTLEMSGFGTLVLAGNNTYTGATNVNAGTLDVTGSIASSSLVTVANGGALTGTGTLGSLQIASGGIFAPGSGTPGGSTAIAGNLALESGALYLVAVNPATASFASVSGTASLAGTVDATFATGNYISKVYSIVSAGTVSGEFKSLSTTNLPANFTASLSYDSAHAYLDLTLKFVTLPTPTPFLPPVFTPLNGNESNVANTLVNYFNTNGIIATKFGTLSSSGLTQVDGEDATGAEHGALELTNEFLSLMLDPFVYGRGGPASGGGALGFAPDQDASLPSDVALAYAGILKAPPPSHPSPTSGGGSGWGLDQRWTVWGASYGGSATFDGSITAGSTNVTASTYGFAAGADYHLASDTVLGFALAGAGTNWGLEQGIGTGRSDAFQAGLYGTKYFGAAYLGGALAFTNNWFTTNRIALGDQITANFQGQSYGVRVEGGYRLTPSLPSPASEGGLGWAIGVTPYAALQAQDLHTPVYSETDLTGGGFGLAYNAMNATDTRSELGARFDDLTTWGAVPVQLRARIAWAHDRVSDPALDASFQALPGTSFVVNGAPVPHDSALTSVGADMHLTPRWTLLGKFDGEFASSAQTYAGSGTLRYVW